VPAALFGMEGYWCYWHGEKGYSGVGLHVHKSLAPERPAFSHPEFNFENRIAAVELGDLTVASVYVPNGGKDYAAKLRFLEALDAYAESFTATGRRLVLCGDLNVALTDRDVHVKERKPKAIGQLPEERDLLARLLSRGLTDVGRAVDPGNENLFTWWPPWRDMRKRNIGWRIDYILASTPLAATATACPVLAEVGTSDHAPVMATFV
jgi:exodeoxyribonuclease-3